MPKRPSIPIALTIAGSDSGGGAGIQADLKTFSSLGVHGASVITCITAQNPRGVWGIETCTSTIIRTQLEAVFQELRPRSVKTGLLLSVKIIRAVGEFLKAYPRVPLVIDPVVVATTGARFLGESELRATKRELLPRATLITPNIHEAQVLTGESIDNIEDMRLAARAIHRQFGCAALIKGGHLRGGKEAADIFYDGADELLLTARFIRGVKTHGTGCTYSAAITAYLAHGEPLTASVVKAKHYITQAIASSRRIGSHQVLGPQFAPSTT